MKTEKTRQLLEQALKSLESSPSAFLVRSYMLKALDEINHIEKKKVKREQEEQETLANKWKSNLQSGLINANSQNANNMLNNIDKMIQAEQEKINSLNKRSGKSQVFTD